MNDSKTPSDSPVPRPPRRRWIRVVIVLAVLAAVACAAFYHYITTGGLIARQSPSALETAIARKLVNLSIPNESKALKNPLGNSDAAVAAGRDLYQKNCEVCHAYDGSGKTAAASGLYPPPVNLSHAAIVKRKRTDGDLFYLIRNGIRNTAMPGWQLPDQQTWQLVSFIRKLPLTASVDAQSSAVSQAAP